MCGSSPWALPGVPVPPGGKWGELFSYIKSTSASGLVSYTLLGYAGEAEMNGPDDVRYGGPDLSSFVGSCSATNTSARGFGSRSGSGSNVRRSRLGQAALSSRAGDGGWSDAKWRRRRTGTATGSG
jgi:hypothetical protein